MKSVLPITVFLLAILPASFALGNQSDPCSFYQKPTFENLRSSISVEAESLRHIADKGDFIHALNCSAISLAYAFSQYPSYVASFEKAFARLSLHEKAILLRGMRVADITSSLLLKLNESELKKWVFAPDLWTLNTLKALKVTNPDELDYCWAAFAATGDIHFPRKIYEFLKDCSDEDLFVGYEMVNRQRIASFLSHLQQEEGPNNPDDLLKNLRVRYPNEDDFNKAMARIATIAAAIWSIDGVLNQDASFKLKVNEMLRENPHLDFWGRLKKILGYSSITKKNC